MIMKQEQSESESQSLWADKVVKSSRNTTYFLKRLFIGKFLGARRLEQLILEVDNDDYRELLIKVFRNEKKHLLLIEGLLANRGIPLPRAGWRKTRYWRPVLKAVNSVEEHFAIAYYITVEINKRTLAVETSKYTPPDIRVVFNTISADERQAISVFKLVTSTAALIAMKEVHQRGIDKLHGN